MPVETAPQTLTITKVNSEVPFLFPISSEKMSSPCSVFHF